MSARKLRPIRIRQALFKVTSCHIPFFFYFFRARYRIRGSVHSVQQSGPPLSPSSFSPFGSLPSALMWGSRAPLVAAARYGGVRGRVYTCIRTRAHEGGLTSGRLYPEYPPRCLAQWGLSSLILSAGESEEKRREEKTVRRADVIFPLPLPIPPLSLRLHQVEEG